MPPPEQPVTRLAVRSACKKVARAGAIYTRADELGRGRRRYFCFGRNTPITSGSASSRAAPVRSRQ